MSCSYGSVFRPMVGFVSGPKVSQSRKLSRVELLSANLRFVQWSNEGSTTSHVMLRCCCGSTRLAREFLTPSLEHVLLCTNSTSESFERHHSSTDCLGRTALIEQRAPAEVSARPLLRSSYCFAPIEQSAPNEQTPCDEAAPAE
jgi:hypothetical protein